MVKSNRCGGIAVIALYSIFLKRGGGWQWGDGGGAPKGGQRALGELDDWAWVRSVCRGGMK